MDKRIETLKRSNELLVSSIREVNAQKFASSGSLPSRIKHLTPVGYHVLIDGNGRKSVSLNQLVIVQLAFQQRWFGGQHVFL
jgi:hypothetical protein